MITQFLGKEHGYAIQWYQVQVTEPDCLLTGEGKLQTSQPNDLHYWIGEYPGFSSSSLFQTIFYWMQQKWKKQNNIRLSQILLEHNFEVSNSVQHIDNGRSFVPFLTQLPIRHQLNSYITKTNKSSGLKCTLKCLQGDDSNNNDFKDKQRRSWPIKTFKKSTHLFGMEHLRAEGQPAIKKK